MGFHWPFGLGNKESAALIPELKITCSSADTCEVRLNLAEAEPGATVEICCLDGDGPISRRLAEMGFIPGTMVEVLRRAPLHDPIEFQLRGYLVSLRREEACRVRIRKVVSLIDATDE